MNNLQPAIKPNLKQQECINTIEGPVMVLAGPGTGKTFTIIQRIKYMLETGIEPASILCLTYSAAAANEMKARLVKEIGTTAAAVTVNTYHAFANDIIKQYPNEFELLEGVGLADEITKRSIMSQTLEEVKPQFYRTKWGDAYYFIPDHLKSVDEIKFNRVTKQEYFDTLKSHSEWQGKMDLLEIEYKEREEKGKLVKKFLSSYESHKRKMNKAVETWSIYEKYDEILKRNNFIDFNDMINMVLDVFESNEDLLKKAAAPFKYFLVDEYQDTNFAQNKIVSLLAKGAESNNIFVVGDDDQIIYEFQGAKTDTLEKFLTKYPDTKVICLNENNRSTQNILDFSYMLISQDKTRLEFNPEFSQYNISKALTAKNEKINKHNKKVQIHGFSDIKQENNFIVKTIQDLINSEDCPKNDENKKDLSKIAILSRENAELTNFASLLEAKNIPYQLKESKSIFDIKSSLVIYFYLKALMNHVFNADKLFGLLLAEPFCFDNADYSFLLEENRKTNKDLITNIKSNLEGHKWVNPIRVRIFIQTFNELSDLKGKLNLKELVIETINRTGILEHFLNSEVRKSDNLYAIKKIVDEAESFMYLHKAAWLGDFLNHIDTAFESNIALTIDKEEYTQNAVQLITLHSSKGREFDYVYIPNLTAKKWEGKRRTTAMSLPIDKEDKKTDEETARKSEQLRLLFVGVTRAKHSLFLSYSNSIDANPQELTSYLSEAAANSEVTETFNHELKEDEYLSEIAEAIKKEPYDYGKVFKDELKARTEKFVISHSSLSAYFNCPRGFMYSNILKIPVLGEDMGNANYGSAIHRTLQFALSYAKENEKYPDIQKFLENFDKNLDMEKFETADIRETYRERGKNSLQKYYKQMLETPPNRVIATEYVFNFVPYENHFIKGFIDRIEKNSDGTYSVYDYKTGEAKSKKKIADGMDYEHYLNQLRFYKFAYELKNPGAKVSSAGLIFVEEPDNNFFTELTRQDNELIKNKLDEAYTGIANLNFNPPQENERKCSYCSYKHLCKLADMT